MLARLHALFAPRSAATDIAVVVPLYNHARFIAEALRSVLAQTAAPREIVLLDDGSIDGGLARAQHLLRDVPNCRVLAQPNAGAHAALNRAIAMTHAPYIAVLNSDDRFVPQKLAWCQALFATAPAPDLIAGRVALIGPRGAALRRGPAADWLVRARTFASRAASPQLALLHENFVATTSNMVFSRALWQRVGGFAALRYCHDLEFLMRAYDHGRVLLDPRVHVHYRVHPGNTIAEDGQRIRAELAAVVAATLFDAGDRLAPAGSNAVQDLLRAKHLAEAVPPLLDLRARCADRDAFLAFAITATVPA